MDGNLVFSKDVDMSVLREGFSIPERMLPMFFGQLGFRLNHGEKRPIRLLIDGIPYQAKLINQAFNQEKYPTHGDVVQIRYNKALASLLREKFSATLQRLQNGQTPIPVEERETLCLYATPVEGDLLADCVTAGESAQAAAELRQLDEWSAETAVDSTASIVLSTGTRKIRRLSRSIGDSLKQLYDCRCQICGQKIGEPYGSRLIHAHHIDYFIRSLNNDADNILIVCPNHHAVIHDRNPEFIRADKIYRYPNGYTEGLKLNKHL